MRLLVWTAWGLVACTGDATQDQAPVNISDVDEDGFSSAEGDCDDTDPTIFPGADDVVGDGIDRNCDQSDGVDADFDGDPSQASGGGDCNDNDASINSEAEEIGWDGIDQDCDLEDQYDFDDICAGDRFSCGVNSIGQVFCWGDDSDGVVSNRPQTGEFVQIDCGNEFVCARRADNVVECWGGDDDGGVSDAPDVPALGLATGFRHACIIRQVDGQPECWGEGEAYEGVATINVAVRDMALGSRYSCFTRNNGGQIACVGVPTVVPVNMANPAPTPNDVAEWIKISGGNQHICGIGNDQNMYCMSQVMLTNGERAIPNAQGPYSWIDVYNDWACAIKEATELSCWGSSFNQVASSGFAFGQPTADVSLFQVAVGREHACALRNEDAEVICWGIDNAGETLVPDFAGYAEQ